MLREAGEWVRDPVYRAECEQQVATMRATLGEQAFVAAWAEGKRMTRERAIVFAREPVSSG